MAGYNHNIADDVNHQGPDNQREAIFCMAGDQRVAQ